MSPRPRASFLPYHRSLLKAYGRQGWWPARTPFEVIVGAILTQGVSWRNVELAIARLRRDGLLDPGAMRRAPRARLARLVRPAGYYNQKAAKLKAFLGFLWAEHGGDLRTCLSQPADILRRQLLGIRGIGPETADAIILYAAGRPVFVVDAYTVRILSRHGRLAGDEPYEEVRRRLEAGLPRDAALYKEFHALLVRVAKERCLKGLARCDGCPLSPHLAAGSPGGRTVDLNPRV
jgi:endonuclease-3 related protein